MLVGLFLSAGHGVQPGMQTEGYEHELEHEYDWDTVLSFFRSSPVGRELRPPL